MPCVRCERVKETCRFDPNEHFETRKIKNRPESSDAGSSQSSALVFQDPTDNVHDGNTDGIIYDQDPTCGDSQPEQLPIDYGYGPVPPDDCIDQDRTYEDPQLPIDHRYNGTVAPGGWAYDQRRAVDNLFDDFLYPPGFAAWPENDDTLRDTDIAEENNDSDKSRYGGCLQRAACVGLLSAG